MANPNPDPQYQWKKGQSGNPSGMSAETKARLDKARDKSIQAYGILVDALVEDIGKDGATGVIDAIRGDNLKLLKDIIDRSVGTPKSSVDLSSEDGSMTPSSNSDAVLDALTRKHADK